MSERPVKILLEDILDAINTVLEYVSVDSYETFVSEKMRVDAVIRNIEIIGEAINKLPSEFLNKHTEVEWHKAISMRNRLIHAYFNVDNKIVWHTCSFVLPSLKLQIDKLLKQF